MEFVETKERYLFSGVCWKDVRMILNMAAKMMQQDGAFYTNNRTGGLEHKIMQLEVKAKWTFKTFMAGDKRVKSIESQSVNTEFRLSRCNIAFENSEGLYSNHIAFK